jgi:error-prone DNA polymerase
LRLIKGLAEADAARLVAARGAGYADARDLWRRGGVGRAVLERLAAADALRSLDRASETFGNAGLDRRRGLWALKALGEPPLPLFAAAAVPPSPRPSPAVGEREKLDQEREQVVAALLPEMPLGEHVFEDYATTGLTIKRHPLAFLRSGLRREGLVSAADLAVAPVGRRLAIAGLVLIRQRPGSANGVVFITIEDETGVANLIVWPATLERHRRAALGATLLYCRGRLQREESVIHLVAEDLRDWTARLEALREPAGAEPPPARARPRIPRQDRRDLVIPSRDFR